MLEYSYIWPKHSKKAFELSLVLSANSLIFLKLPLFSWLSYLKRTNFRDFVFNCSTGINNVLCQLRIFSSKVQIIFLNETLSKSHYLLFGTNVAVLRSYVSFFYLWEKLSFEKKGVLRRNVFRKTSNPFNNLSRNFSGKQSSVESSALEFVSLYSANSSIQTWSGSSLSTT